MRTTNDCNDCVVNHVLDLSRFRHFGHEWQQICETLLSCEQLLQVMSNERPQSDDDDSPIDDDDQRRQQLRQTIRSIEPKKYSKSCSQRRQSARRSSYHRLKALTQLLMSSNLKRSTSLQSVPVVNNDVEDDATATLPRLRRRPRMTRTYHSFDDNNDNESDDSRRQTTADRSGLSLVLSSTQLTTTSVSQNRHSCDVTSLLLSSSPSSSQNRDNGFQLMANRQKYPKKKLRGPYGELLESMMKSSSETKPNLLFIQELLRETHKQRQELDASARETTGTSTSTTTTTGVDIQTTKETTPSSSSITAAIGRHLDTRTHIVGELYDTEKSFCEQLRDLLEKYAKPLTELLVIDSLFVETIFGKIPDILAIHSKFLEDLRHRIADWSPTETTIGDMFSVFGDRSCVDAYLSFVDNWFEAKQLIKQLTRDKPMFQRFLVEASRDHRSKLSLDELMIAVIQRIPRFELLLKQLLKNTCGEHVDFPLLTTGLTTIHALVARINRVQNEANAQSVSPLLDVSPQCLTVGQLEALVDGLPTSLLTGTTLHDMAFVVIRKRERILLLFSTLLLIVSIKGKKRGQKFEENKYKVLNYFLLDVFDVARDDGVDGSHSSHETLDALEKDLNVLQTMESSLLTRLSSHSRHFLEAVFAELNANINKRMSEMRNQEKNLELVVSAAPTTSTTTHNDTGTTATTSSTTSIVMTFLSQERRQKFAQTLSELKNHRQRPSARLLFLSTVPIRKTRAGLQFTCASPTIGTNEVWICNSDGFVGQISVLSLKTSTGAPLEPVVISCNGVCNSRIICMTCVPKARLVATPAHALDTDHSSDSDCTDISSSAVSPDRLCWPTMWFGTEDSSVHIYSCFDAIRIKKNKVKVTLSAKVEAITYFAERVFVSLANQSVAVFQRETTGAWNTTPTIREDIDCFRFCPVLYGQQLWTSGHSMVITVRDVTLTSLNDISVVDDTTTTTADDDFITQMVSVDAISRVFVSTHNSLSIHLFTCSADALTRVTSVSIQSSLQRALIHCEDIIRQHKSACLKISSLLAQETNVWIGTSAGIVCVLDAEDLDLEIVPNGHTGHVRFLTRIQTVGPDGGPLRTVVISGGDGVELYRQYGGGVGSGQGSGVRCVDSGREDSTNHLLLWEI